MKSFTALRNPELRKVCLIPLISNSTASMTWAIAVPYAISLKATVLQINLVTTMWATMGIFLQVPFGILSDKFGRKRMLLIPQIMMLLGTVLRALATDANQLVIASIVGGFAGGSFFPILLSIVGDVTSTEEKSKGITLFFTFSSIGMLIGPTVASLILTLPFAGIRNIYQLDGIFQTFVVFYIVFRLKETKSDTARTSFRGNVSQLLMEKGMLAVIIMSVLYFLHSSIMNNYVPMYAEKGVGLPVSLIASFSSYRNLGIVLIRLSSVAILARFAAKHFLTLMLALGGATAFLTPHLGSYSALGLLMFFYGTSFGATMLLSSVIVAEVSTTSNRGIANSINSLAQSCGIMMQILTTPIAENMGLIPVFALGSLLPLLAVVPLAFLYKPKTENSDRQKNNGKD